MRFLNVSDCPKRRLADIDDGRKNHDCQNQNRRYQVRTAGKLMRRGTGKDFHFQLIHQGI